MILTGGFDGFDGLTAGFDGFDVLTAGFDVCSKYTTPPVKMIDDRWAGLPV